MEDVKYSLENEILTVSSLNNILKEIIDSCYFLKNIHLKGELSSFKKHSSGHYFFILKDKSSSISATLFSFNDKNYDLTFKDGDEVDLYGSINVYNKKGTYNFIVNKMSYLKEGDLLLKKKQLLEKLEKEGYLSSERKKVIKKVNQRIGIITSSSGAALIDCKKNILERFPIADIKVYNCLVQGKEAPRDIEKALLLADADNLDVLILTRGGGSSEDLSAFDDERLAYCILNLKTPIVSAIGHEIDFSVSDYVSDYRVSTPTGAALKVVPSKNDIIEYLNISLNEAKSLIMLKIAKYHSILKELESLNIKERKIRKISQDKIRLNNLLSELKSKYLNYLNELNNLNTINIKTLNIINPLSILNKGYAIIKDENDNILKNINDISRSTLIKIIMHDGEIIVKKE